MAKGPLRVAIEDWWGDLKIPQWIEKQVVTLLSDLATVLHSVNLRALSSLPGNITPPAWLGIEEAPTSIGDVIAIVFFNLIGLFGALVPLLTEGIRPYTESIRRFVNREDRPERLDPGTMMAIGRRIPGVAGQMDSYIAETGIPDDLIAGLRELDHPLLSAGNYLDAWNRGDLDLGTMISRLSAAGFETTEINVLLSLAKYIISPNQAVEAANHGAFDDSLAAKYGLDEGMTDVFQKIVRQAGGDSSVAAILWRASRFTPPLSTGLEMLHRLRPGRSGTPFTQDDLASLMKLNGIPSYWAGRLASISYNPLPRLIIRGMYQAGTMNREDVKQAVLDLGFDPSKADAVTDYLCRDAKSTQQGLSRDALIQAYTRGIISRDDAKSGIVAGGMSTDDAEFYLSLADYNIEAQKTDERLKVIQARYVSGAIDEVELSNELNQLNLPSSRMTDLTDLWNIQRNNKIVIPSKSDLDYFLENNIITQDQYVAYLNRLGVEAAAVPWYVAKETKIMAANAATDLANAQAEQERLALATLKNDYQTQRQAILVDIAQYNAAIADLNVQISQSSDNDQKTKMKQTIIQYKDAIKYDQFQAAQLEQTLKQNVIAASTPPAATGGTS